MPRPEIIRFSEVPKQRQIELTMEWVKYYSLDLHDLNEENLEEEISALYQAIYCSEIQKTKTQFVRTMKALEVAIPLRASTKSLPYRKGPLGAPNMPGAPWSA